MSWLDDRLEEINTLDEQEKQEALDKELLNAYSAYGVEFWINAGANPNAQDEQGRTKLMKDGDISVTNTLLSLGADVNIVDNRGYKAVSYAINPEAYHLLRHRTDMGENDGYLKAREAEDGTPQTVLNEMFIDAQEEIRRQTHNENVDKFQAFKYDYLRDNISDEKAEKLIAFINEINDEIEKNSYDEGDSIENLSGMSLEDIDKPVFSRKAEKIAATYVTEGGLDAIPLLVMEAKDTPAYNLIMEKYSVNYRYSDIRRLIDKSDNSSILMHDIMLLAAKLDPQYLDEHEKDLARLNRYRYERVMKMAANPNDDEPRNFLAAYSAQCEHLARLYLGDRFDSNWLQHIENDVWYMEKSNQIWQEMLKNKDAYIHDNTWSHYIDANVLSKEQYAQFNALFGKEKTEQELLQDALDKISRERKIHAAVVSYEEEQKRYTNAPLYDVMLRTGVENYSQAKRCIDLYWKLNARPESYNSPYNKYPIYNIAKLVKMINVSPEAEWMYPILLKAAEAGHINLWSGRQPSERALFDACRTWKVCPKVPLRLAKKIGKYSLSGRILAGAVFEKMYKESGDSMLLWEYDKTIHNIFFGEVSKYLKMERGDALNELQAYIGKGNRKRLIIEAMTAAGIKYEENKERYVDDYDRLYGSYDLFKTENFADVIKEYAEAVKKLDNVNNSDYEFIMQVFTVKQIANSKVLERIISEHTQDKQNYLTLDSVYEVLNDIIQNQPELTDDALDVYKTVLQSYKDYYGDPYRDLRNIVISNPQLADKILDVFGGVLQSERNCQKSIRQCYGHLRVIISEQPQLADKVFNIFEKTFKSDKNIEYSLKVAYGTLEFMIKDQPQWESKALELFNMALRSQSNTNETIYEAISCVRGLSECKLLWPEWADKIIDTLGVTFEQPDKLGSISLACIYEIMDHIITGPSALVTSVDSDLGLLHSQTADRILKNIQTAMQSDRNDGCSIRKANILQKKCMRLLPLDETIAKYPDMEQDLRIAHKARFASDEEFMYALEHFDKKTLAESMIFRAQQRVMNVLVSTSFVEFCDRQILYWQSRTEDGQAKEELKQSIEKIKEEVSLFRKPDAPDEIQRHVSENKDWLIPASFKGAAVFKEYFPAYIKQIQNHNRKNPDDVLSIHDAVYWLPDPNMSKEANAHLSEFIRNNIIYQNAEHKMVHRPLDELKIIAHNWKSLENKLQKQGEIDDISKLKYSDVLSICMSVKYSNQRNDKFAVEAAKHGINERQYAKCEDIYLVGLKVPEPFDSKKEFKEGKYTGRFLPRDDVRTGFFGSYTNCCQHFGGVGGSCAVSTVKHPFSQLFVIEDDKGKIIAGSWTWENTEGDYREVCFDNIESLGELQNRPEINRIYEQVGKYLTDEQNCRRVTIGLGCQDADVSGYETTEAIALPKLYGHDGTGCYSDARSQVLLAENPNAEPLDKTQESQRYIRDVCCFDENAMIRVSAAVFPDSDQQLQKPDNMAGFVIEDREKGVVGYCLYDKEEKSVYDMAVLPEYRTDKNASSKKLFAEMMRVIREEGGKWSAEMRDKTTLKYLEIMAKRGLVKFEKHGVDHVMSDGSRVVKVTFEPVRDEVRQATNKLKGKVEESAVAKTVDMKPSATAHGAGIIKDSDAREA